MGAVSTVEEGHYEDEIVPDFQRRASSRKSVAKRQGSGTEDSPGSSHWMMPDCEFETSASAGRSTPNAGKEAAMMRSPGPKVASVKSAR